MNLSFQLVFDFMLTEFVFIHRFGAISKFRLKLQNVSIKTTVRGGTENTLPQGKELMFKELNILTTY